MSVDGVRLNFELHRVMCEAFHGMAPFPDAQVRHLNGIKSDNRPENLAWGTRSENAQDTLEHGQDWHRAKTHCPKRHEYTPQNTMYVPKPGRRPYRRCRTCDNAQQRRKCRRRKVEGLAGMPRTPLTNVEKARLVAKRATDASFKLERGA